MKTFENLGFSNFSDFFGMLTNGFEPWTISILFKKAHFVDKLENQSKYSDFLEI